VAALILQGEHDGCQLIVCDFVTHPLVTDVKVLAKQAQQIAMGEKNCAGTVGSDKRCFFSEMRTVAGYPGKFAGFAKSGFAGQPINTAFSGAKHTGFQEAAGLRCFFLQNPLFTSPDISWFIGSHFKLSHIKNRVEFNIQFSFYWRKLQAPLDIK
jgi:hypothetical protein